MKRKSSGTIVMELNHAGIPDSELQPEEFDEQQLAVLNALEERFQENIRKGYPYAVMDMESGETLAKYNLHNVKPSETQWKQLGRGLLDAFLEWRKNPENVKMMEEELGKR